MLLFCCYRQWPRKDAGEKGEERIILKRFGSNKKEFLNLNFPPNSQLRTSPE